MITKRIIPCLDVKDGRVVKGVNFLDLRDAGDPVEVAKVYNAEGADELVFLDITASSDRRNTVVDMVEKVANSIFIPFTVGGGIREVDDIRAIVGAGADKVAMNTAAVKNPQLISDGAKVFGSQCIVVAMDVKFNGKFWEVFLHGGRTPTGIDGEKWAKEAEDRGAGEILLTSMDKDGTKDGFDLDITSRISTNVNIPVIASGGAGNLQHLVDGVKLGKADAVLAVDFADELERLKDLTPVTIEEAEEKIYPIRQRFLLWTRDGAHIMWGFYGNGRFVGTDNLGKRCWGIYGKGVFAGFYDGEFFWGRYHNGTWRAQYLFGLKYARGRYVLFPAITSAENAP